MNIHGLACLMGGQGRGGEDVLWWGMQLWGRSVWAVEGPWAVLGSARRVSALTLQSLMRTACSTPQSAAVTVPLGLVLPVLSLEQCHGL